MNYQNKLVGITGYDGFIGKELVVALQNEGANVVALQGDVRDPLTFSVLTHEYDYLFHFGSPSSQVLFGRQKAFSADVTLTGFANAAAACKKNGIKLIYPSTGLLSQERTNEYATCKLMCEQYAQLMDIDSLAIRIFATYGPGEGHKRDYASVPYLFARDMVEDRAPVIFGNGEQVRDFIYIDDTINAILTLAERCNDRVIDVGSGHKISFNEIIRELKVITAGPDAVFVERPGNYVDETLADPTRLHQFYIPKITFAEGIARTVDSLKEEKPE